jgi:hypothetical protein
MSFRRYFKIISACLKKTMTPNTRKNMGNTGKGCIEGLLILILMFITTHIDERRKRWKWSMSVFIERNVLEI